MTKEEFYTLSPDQQDSYINSQLPFSPSVPVSTEVENKQMGAGVILSSPDEVSGVILSPSNSPSATFISQECGPGPNRKEVQSTQEQNPHQSNEPIKPVREDASSYLKGLDIRNPFELLMLFDDEIGTGRQKLHGWQKDFLMDFASSHYDDKFPFQAVVRACNGSGKDKFIIAPCVVWLCMAFEQTSGVVTSSSGFQLDRQTCLYITRLCESINRSFGTIWKINYRYFECLLTKSIINCFATDEAGKAEGFHPTVSGAKMGMFESEAKTVPDEIYIAQNKCTGYTHRVIVSTPGLPLGHFFDLCQMAIDRKDLVNAYDCGVGNYVQYHIKASDCSHLPSFYIEQMKRDLPGGENGAAFKSQVHAEFGSTDEMVVMSSSHIYRCRNNKTIQHIPAEFNEGGLDLSAGGAESVLIVRNGNKLLAVEPFKFEDTEDAYPYLEDLFRKYHLINSKAYVNGDCVGIGKPMLDRMRRSGWRNIRYFDSRHGARNTKTYFRLGDEIWFDVARFVTNQELIIGDDQLLMKQLASRYYKILEGKHKLLSKAEQKSKGYPSPDRADAFVYCFYTYQSSFVSYLSKDEHNVPLEPEVEYKIRPLFTLKNRGKSQDIDLRSRINDGPTNDFSELQAEVTEYNKRIKLLTK